MGSATGEREERFRALFEGCFGAVRRYVHHRGVALGRDDDLVAETFVVAWRRLDDVPADDPLPWLLAVARNQWRNERRSYGRRSAALRRLPLPLPVPPPDEPPDGDRDHATAAAIGAALAALPETDRELLLLVAWDDLTPAQAAQAVGCSAGAARVRLHRARRRFADELTKRSLSNGQIPDECEARKEDIGHGHA
jgi:RNA polymerase sigma factor (sigma-70 family)